MRIFYFLFIALSFLFADRVNAQHLSQNEILLIKQKLDKQLLPTFAIAKAKAESQKSRDAEIVDFPDSIHTFSKFSETEDFAPNLNFYYTYEVNEVENEVIITSINIKVLDGSLPVENLIATPTYDDKERITRIKISTVIFGIPQDLLVYYYNYDEKDNTTSLILESPGLFGADTTYVGDSIQFIYGSGDRVLGYNSYTLLEDNWLYSGGVADLTYDAQDNVTSLTEWWPSGDTVGGEPTRSYTIRNIEWYENSMPSNFINPLGVDSDEIETGLIGVELVEANEGYQTSPVSFIQASYIDGVLVDSTLVREYEEVSDRFTLFDSYYESGALFYTQIDNYFYDGDDLTSHEILYDLGLGGPVPLSKTDYEHNEYGLIKAENFTFDQGLWISSDVTLYEYVVEDEVLLEFIETIIDSTDYQSYKTVFFPSDLETSINETELTDEQVVIYPTLVKDNLIINLQNNLYTENMVISVWDLNSKLVISQRYDASFQNLELNVSGLSSGMYILNVQVPSGTRSVRFIKE